MTTNNLWGEIPEEDKTPSPVGLLHEQAEILAQHTGGYLNGRVDTETTASYIVNEFFIVAPFLNNYQVVLLRVRHGALMYPLTLLDLVKDRGAAIECKNNKEFEDGVANILSSQEVHQIVASLLTQSKS